MSASIRHADHPPTDAAAVVVGDRLSVTLRDGRELAVPISWFGWLADAPEAKRADLRIIENGLGLWWQQLDKGLPVPDSWGCHAPRRAARRPGVPRRPRS
jgi:hypothetical protein